jgi:putative phosphoesterase
VTHIAVIADTHDRVPRGLTDRLARADEIWHLGDVCAPETLALFEDLGRPLFVVLGNNEWHNLWPEELRLERAGHRFYLTHIPPDRAPANCGFVLHGHTHVPRDETDARGVRWLNPGCITRPNRGAPPSFAWLVVEPNQAPTWKLELI